MQLHYLCQGANAIALYAFAQAHVPMPDLLALPPVAVPMALPSMVPTPILLSPAVPMAFSTLLPDDSVHRWLTAALPLVLAADEGGKSVGNMIAGVGTAMGDDGEIVRGESEVPVVSAGVEGLLVAPVKSRQGKWAGNGGADAARTTPKNSTPPKRSPKTATTTAL